MRPRSLDDLMLSQSTIESLKHLSATARLPHMIFFGTNGVGKTSAARILTNREGVHLDAKEFIDYKNEKKFVAELRDFAFTSTLFEEYKICILNEADLMSKVEQTYLATLVETFEDSCRFILTTNSLDKITLALKSRFMPICFNILPSDYSTVTDRLFVRYKSTLTENKYYFTEQRLREIIQMTLPDMRAIANKIDFEFKKAPS